MRRLAILAATLTFAAIVVLICGAALFCQMTLRPWPRLASVAPMDARSVTITARDGAVLRAWWRVPSHSNGNCVVVLHGIGDSRAGANGFAPMFLDAGYSVLIPDSRAHGESDGSYVTYGLLESTDTIDWARWMKSSGCARLYALGESLGASVLIESAAVESVFSAIVAESAFADLREVAAYRLRSLFHVPAVLVPALLESSILYARAVDNLNLDRVSPVTDIAHATTPILLIHGLSDWRTPPDNSERLAKANPRDPLWLVPGAGHVEASAKEPQEFRRRVLSWFAGH